MKQSNLANMCLNKTMIAVMMLLGAIAAQAQAQNPFPANPNAGAINYNSGNSNLSGDRQVVIPQANPQANVNNIMTPNAAMTNMNVPVTPPVGLPPVEQQQQTQVTTPGMGQGRIDPAQAALNILNADPQRIREINRDLYKRGRVINEGPVAAPRVVNDVVVAHLSPGSTAPVIRLSRNRSTAILITDSSGQPWPIINYDGLSEEDFIVKRLDNPAPDGYVLSVTPRGTFVSGNLVVVLKGLPTPLNIEFVSAQKIVDGTTQIRVQAMGPNSQFTSMGLPASMDSEMLNILKGVAPQGAKELRVSSKAVQAWLARDGSMYVRTRYRVMSPAFEQVTSSPDGTFAYKMIPVGSVLFKASEGRFGEFTISGF